MEALPADLLAERGRELGRCSWLAALGLAYAALPEGLAPPWTSAAVVESFRMREGDVLFSSAVGVL